MAVQLRVKADVKQATRYLKRVQRKQVPFATAKALTATAQDTQKNLVKGMKRDLHRPTPFTQKGIGIRRATKKNLTASVFVKPIQLEYLKWAIFGGTRQPRSQVIIIGNTRRNQYGNTPGFRKFRSRQLAKANVFEGEVNGQAGIWERKRRGGVKLLALYVDSATYRKRFRFFERARKTAQARFPKQFDRAMKAALRTAR